MLFNFIWTLPVPISYLGLRRQQQPTILQEAQVGFRTHTDIFLQSQVLHSVFLTKPLLHTSAMATFVK